MNFVWVTEYKAWFKCNNQNCYTRSIDTMLMHLTSTLEKAIELIKEGPYISEGWYSVYLQSIDKIAPNLPTEFLNFDMKGNLLEGEPGRDD